MHSSHIATENWMKCGFSYETDCCRNYCEESFWINLDILCRCWSLTMVDLTECCMLTVHGSHTLIKICSYLTVSQRKSSKFTWKSLHVSHNIVCSQICHKHIHIMGWKDQTSKEIATCGKFVSLSSCCEKAAAGMLRPFPVHFIPLQSNSMA